MELDCAIVGGGPAGLSAALVLGRACRKVVVFDDGKPRNAVTRHTHGFLTRDGATPQAMRKLAWEDLNRYDTVKLVREKVTEAVRWNAGFRLVTANGNQYAARKLLLATGLSETLPDIPDVNRFYGASLFSCPYCDGWELREQPLIVIGQGKSGFALARLVSQWSKDILLCTNGAASGLTTEELRILWSRGVYVTEHKITKLAGQDGRLSAVHLDNGSTLRRVGGFLSPYWRQDSPFGSRLGCVLNGHGGLETDGQGRCSVHGVYAAGDVTVRSPAQAIIAAGSGSAAAMSINGDLIAEDVR